MDGTFNSMWQKQQLECGHTTPSLWCCTLAIWSWRLECWWKIFLFYSILSYFIFYHAIYLLSYLVLFLSYFILFYFNFNWTQVDWSGVQWSPVEFIWMGGSIAYHSWFLIKRLSSIGNHSMLWWFFTFLLLIPIPYDLCPIHDTLNTCHWHLIPSSF